MNYLPVAQHGHFNSQSRKPPYGVGEIAHLICDAGFAPETITQSVLVQSNGKLKWDPPSISCIPILTNLPTAINGHFVSDRRQPPYMKGTVAKLKCDEGYHSSIHQSVLGKDMQWSPPSATCLPVSCSPPQDLDEHGRRHGHDFTFPNSVHYACEDGYFLNHSVHKFYCSPEGRWQPPIPQNLACEPVLCPEIQAPPFGVIRGSQDRGYGSIVTFQCLPGFVMTRGQRERRCQADGTWSGEDVRCELTHASPNPKPKLVPPPVNALPVPAPAPKLNVVHRPVIVLPNSAHSPKTKQNQNLFWIPFCFVIFLMVFIFVRFW